MENRYDQEGYPVLPYGLRTSRFWRLLSWLARHWFLALAGTVREQRVNLGERAADFTRLVEALRQTKYRAEDSEAKYKSQSRRVSELQDKATERDNIARDCSDALSFLLKNHNWCIGSVKVSRYPYHSHPYLSFTPELNDTRRQDGRATPETIAKLIQSYTEIPDGWKWKEDTRELVKPASSDYGFSTDFRVILAAILSITGKLQIRLDKAIEAEQVKDVLKESHVPEPTH